MATDGRNRAGVFGFDRLKDIEKIAGGRLDQVIRGTLLDLSAKIIRRSPVGDPDLWVVQDSDGNYVDYIAERGYPEGYIGGTFRGNWQVTIGSPAQAPLEITDKNGAKTIAAAKAATKDAPGNIWYITNNMPYAQRLEFGWSTQAPGGFVRVSLAELNKSIDEQIAQLP